GVGAGFETHRPPNYLPDKGGRQGRADRRVAMDGDRKLAGMYLQRVGTTLPTTLALPAFCHCAGFLLESLAFSPRYWTTMEYFIIAFAVLSGLYFHWWLMVRIRRWS